MYRMIGPALELVSGADPMPAESDSICILDDDASVRHSIEKLLDSDGLKAQSFEDAEIFFAHARSHAVPLAVLDVHRQGNTCDSRRCAGRRRVCLSRKAVRRRGVSFPRPSRTPLRGGK